MATIARSDERTGEPSRPEDLAGTDWAATSIDGTAVATDAPPHLIFDLLGRPDGVGYSGCTEFGFRVELGSATVRFEDTTTEDCADGNAHLHRAFLTALAGVETWTRADDQLTLMGSTGVIELARDLPPADDPARTVAEALRGPGWKILDAPGVANLPAIPEVTFGDATVIAGGECGFAGDVYFLRGGRVAFTDIGWEVTGCGAEDGRPRLKELFEAVTTGRLGPDGRVVLSGTLGEVVLSR